VNNDVTKSLLLRTVAITSKVLIEDRRKVVLSNDGGVA
jgi:hypothetical protein